MGSLSLRLLGKGSLFQAFEAIADPAGAFLAGIALSNGLLELIGI